MLKLLIMMDPTPTEGNLPYWAIGVLVLAVTALFAAFHKSYSERLNQARQDMLALQDRNRVLMDSINKLQAERIAEAKESAVLLNRTISILDNHFTK